MLNKQAAEILNEIGLLLELHGENPFKSRAYYNGAHVLESLEDDLEQLVQENKLKDLPGIGKALTEKITELVSTGRLAYYEELKQSMPPGVMDLLKVPGLGPKKAATLYRELGIASLGELEYACKENRLISLKGFGEKTQENFLLGLASLKAFQGKHLLSDAKKTAEVLLKQIKTSPFVLEAEIGGSIRRAKEVVKDIDFVISTAEPKEAIKCFLDFAQIKAVTSRGETLVHVRLENGLEADLRVVKPEQFSYALHHFTGSKEHNIALRGLAKTLGYKINEYGVFRGEELQQCKNEQDIYRLFALDYIPPELREDRGEIEASLQGRLPQLVESKELKGIFHVHTNYSDGRNSIEEMVKGAISRGYSYLGVSDHSRSAYYAGGLQEKDIYLQHEEIVAVQARYPELRIFKGIEADILPDGSLDYNDQVLSLFDFVIASVHSHFKVGIDLTERLIKAISHPCVTMLGHPTGRLLLARDGYQVDYELLFKEMQRRQVVVELNASPARLDLDWRYLRKAKELGLKISINPDAHRVEDLDDTDYGVLMARKGWLEREDVFNTLDLKVMEDYLKEIKQTRLQMTAQ
ncbi:MAG: DNA polymerase/3'-5' exonuclease PolX [Bacillota bacterium]